MLRGNYITRIDNKGRLKIPTAYRRYLEEQYGPEFYVTSLTGDYARLYPMAEWTAIEERLAALPSMDPARRRFLDRTNYYETLPANDENLGGFDWRSIDVRIHWLWTSASNGPPRHVLVSSG